MIKVQETPHFAVFSEGLGSRVRIERKVNGAFVLLEDDDAQDLIDKLREAGNNYTVMEYWIEAWQYRFKLSPMPSFDNLLPQMARRAH